MLPASQDTERRRPVWEALSSLFLDTELDDDWHRDIAHVIVSSNYTPVEIHKILWEELYPVLHTNLCDWTGEWEGFDLDWLQEQIINGATPPRRILWPRNPKRMLREEWEELLPFLPQHFRQES
jgi:hypothetical protein